MDIIKPTFDWNGELIPLDATKIKYIIVHHAQATRCNVEDIHRWHKSNGWAGFGYGYFVDKTGNVFEGRGTHQGAHCLSYNEISVGICLEGNFERESITITQFNALVNALKWLKTQYPNAQIVGHRDLNKTACPGKNIDIDKINRAVATTYPILRKGNLGEDVKFLQTALNSHGYKLVVDGDFGNLTEKAVKDLQEKNNLAADGIVGPKSWKVIL